MPHSFGYRARTRHLFARDFRKHGPIGLKTYLHVYKIGDYVDIKGNGSIHKGMPHKFYHGKTGRVWNVTAHAVGVEVKKQVGPRYMRKRIHVRIEHVKPSRCNEDFINRKRGYAALCSKAKKEGLPKPSRKRQPAGPRPGEIIPVTSTTKIINTAPKQYTFLM